VGAPLGRIGMVTIDGRLRDIDHPVRPGQRVCLFPYVAGG
jgi:molybdopterin converting factor small subunit